MSNKNSSPEMNLERVNINKNMILRSPIEALLSKTQLWDKFCLVSNLMWW